METVLWLENNTQALRPCNSGALHHHLKMELSIPSMRVALAALVASGLICTLGLSYLRITPNALFKDFVVISNRLCEEPRRAFMCSIPLWLENALYGLHQAPRAWMPLPQWHPRAILPAAILSDRITLKPVAVSSVPLYDVLYLHSLVLAPCEGLDIPQMLQIFSQRLLMLADEIVHKELGDRMERAATTPSSLEAE
ncbi:hypothetical protein Tco_0626858 [Tanacetum coccineum]|uniref:GPI-GlcNAc transferase complex PIG-H component conserved domain-containing protein n=1 Tax=Tanacetum coccineum TaxID=301880 RepID=A0ABQ4WKV2_9ASTR